MTKNPYTDSETLAELLGESEMIADRYSNGGLILIRNKDGWRAFLGTLEEDVLREMEKSLDKNIPSYEQAFGESSRKLNLIDEFHRLLPNCMCFPGYRPMKFIDDLSGDE